MKIFTNSLMILVVGFAVAKTISGVLVNHVIEHFGLLGASQGYMNSVINIGITAAIISTVAFRWKTKKTTMLVISGLITVVMMALTGLSGSFIMLLCVSLVLGVCLGWTDTYANSSIVDVYGEGSAKYQSTMQGCYGVGAIIAPIAIAALLLKNSWQGAYMILAPVILLTIICFAVCLKIAGGQVVFTKMESPKLTGRQIVLFFKDKKRLLLIASCMTYYTMQYGLFAWLVRYMSVQHGAESLGMTCVTIMWVCTSVSRFVAPRLPVDNMKLHTWGSFLAGVTLSIGVFSDNPLIMCAMVGAGALATGNSLPAMINRCIVTYEGETLLPTSAMLLSMQITGTVAPPVLGAIAAYSMQGSMLLLIIAVFIAGLLGLAYLRR
ncbi:MAG: MFS transporter [Clostridiales bacterium]|nr:MFS transporter [Clostridiales bacterium]